MHQDANLIANVAVAFVMATVFGYAADRLRLPALVGYLVAGVVVGRFTPGFTADAALAGQLAEIGVILLMFGVGLHFSVAELLAVRGLVVPGAVIQIFLATLLGVALTSMWGWSLGQGILFGLTISIASTVVFLKALEQRSLLSSPVGRVAVGWLVVEDLAMVLALVLLPAFAEMMGGNSLAGMAGEHGAGSDQPLLLALGITLAKVAAFIAIAALVGPRVVPWVLTRVARTGSRELFTLSVLGLAIGIAFGAATAFGVSFALGAFLAGLIMAESQLSHRAAANSLPLQDAFSVLFFVSIGMLFDPGILVRNPLGVLSVLGVVMIGKALNAVVVVLLLRFPLAMALTIAAGIAQIGEFSFILASLGAALGLMTDEARDLILAAALISITLNLLAFDASERVQAFVARRWPHVWHNLGKARQEALAIELERTRLAAEERAHAQEARINDLIHTFPLLSLVDDDSREELLLLFHPGSASPGEKVIRKGDRGDAMYFLASGAVQVRVAGRAVNLAAGSFFGEMALLTRERRTADVTAIDFCNFLVLDRRDFNQFMSRHPALRDSVNAMAEERRKMNQGPAASGSSGAPGAASVAGA